MQQETFPTLETRATASISHAGSCWVVDYPLAAQQLQKLLYGKTNIALDPNRVNVINNYLTQKPEYTGPSYSQQSSYTGSYETTTGEGWTGETTTADPFATTGTETTTSWWQGIIGPGDSTTAPPVTENPVTDVPTEAPTQAPVQPPTQAPTQDSGLNIPGF